MIASLNEATRTFGTHRMADALDLTPAQVYDRVEGYRQWTVRDAAALALACGRPLSELVFKPSLRTSNQLMN